MDTACKAAIEYVRLRSVKPEFDSQQGRFNFARYREGERSVLIMFAGQTFYRLLLEPERRAL